MVSFNVKIPLFLYSFAEATQHHESPPHLSTSVFRHQVRLRRRESRTKIDDLVDLVAAQAYAGVRAHVPCWIFQADGDCKLSDPSLDEMATSEDDSEAVKLALVSQLSLQD